MKRLKSVLLLSTLMLVLMFVASGCCDVQEMNAVHNAGDAAYSSTVPAGADATITSDPTSAGTGPGAKDTDSSTNANSGKVAPLAAGTEQTAPTSTDPKDTLGTNDVGANPTADASAAKWYDGTPLTFVEDNSALLLADPVVNDNLSNGVFNMTASFGSTDYNQALDYLSRIMANWDSGSLSFNKNGEPIIKGVDTIDGKEWDVSVHAIPHDGYYTYVYEMYEKGLDPAVKALYTTGSTVPVDHDSTSSSIESTSEATGTSDWYANAPATFFEDENMNLISKPIVNDDLSNGSFNMTAAYGPMDYQSALDYLSRTLDGWDSGSFVFDKNGEPAIKGVDTWDGKEWDVYVKATPSGENYIFTYEMTEKKPSLANILGEGKWYEDTPSSFIQAQNATLVADPVVDDSTHEGYFNMAADYSGMTYPELIEHLTKISSSWDSAELSYDSNGMPILKGIDTYEGNQWQTNVTVIEKPEGYIVNYEMIQMAVENIKSQDLAGTIISGAGYPLVTWLKASPWALAELEEANALGLIPMILDGKDLSQPITREEFCELAVLLYERLTKESIEPYSPNPFTDTNNLQILKAYKVGITLGTSETLFSPNLLITREQCATMLYRAITAYNPEGDYSIVGVKDFPDQKDISSYAYQATKFMYKVGIILGDEKSYFRPRPITPAQIASGIGTATREQAILMTLRTYLYFSKK